MRKQFRVIKGGIDIPKTEHGRTFISGHATNTRLMGVIGLELTWDVLKDSRIEKLQQIFYLDCEEFGIESYIEGFGDAPAEVIEERTRLYGALGGDSVPVTEKEARFLIQSHLQINSKYNQPLPDRCDRFMFLTKPAQTISGAEYKNLMKKLGGSALQENYVINYFLMRCVSGDSRGAAVLMDDIIADDEILTPDYRPDMSECGIFMDSTPQTLCRNSIEPSGDPDDNAFFCQSLVEYNNKYYVLTSLIKLNKARSLVREAHKISHFKISSAEAAMLMNRSEFITVYEVLDYSDEFVESFTRFASVFTETVYENGRLYIDFNDTNAHVGKPVYLINNDIHAMYYLTDYGQILVMGYTFEAVQDAEFRLYLSMMPYPIALSMKYEFKEPIFYEFIKSDHTDFGEFIEFLGGQIEPDPDTPDDPSN